LTATADQGALRRGQLDVHHQRDEPLTQLDVDVANLRSVGVGMDAGDLARDLGPDLPRPTLSPLIAATRALADGRLGDE
jgi:hypothetical protein